MFHCDADQCILSLIIKNLLKSCISEMMIMLLWLVNSLCPAMQANQICKCHSAMVMKKLGTYFRSGLNDLLQFLKNVERTMAVLEVGQLETENSV